MYYNRCDMCGANLDPGERCDCQEQKTRQELIYEKLLHKDETNQITMNLEAAYESA